MKYRNVLGRMAPFLVAVALVGYLLGASHATQRAPSTLLVARTAPASNSFVSEYPSMRGWAVASGTLALPGLAVVPSLVLAPHGNVHDAGMIAGEVSGESASPLPASFLARLPEVPRAEVVSLLDTQAYRYGRLIPSGSGKEMTLYVIPRATGSIAVVVCYAVASPVASAYLSTCEQLVGNLVLHIEDESQILPPNVGYARQIGEAITRVDRLRLGLRSAMSRQAPPATQMGAAIRLAEGYGQAARSLATVQAPLAAEWAQAAVSQVLSEAHAAYLALASAAHADSRSSFELARARIAAAEAGIVTALKRYALLGYT